jgi:hypothetical protein
MSFIPGKRVSEIWFKDPTSGALSREEFRLRILTNMAQTMAQFSSLTFDKIGSIMEDGSGSMVIGPVFNPVRLRDGSYDVTALGPFDSTSTYLEANYVEETHEDELGRAAGMLLGATMPCLSMDDSPPGFALCVPNFDSQNIMADDEGNITGLINWDFVQTVPRQLGYSKYPGWIIRDWDPLMYRPDEADSEDSPETLERYRAHYNTEMGKALNWQGDWKYTWKSHMREAIWIAAQYEINRLSICNKFVQFAMGLTYEDSVAIIYRLGQGDDGGVDRDDLEARIKSLMD